MAILQPFLGLLALHVSLIAAVPWASSIPAISSSAPVPSPSSSSLPGSTVLLGGQDYDPVYWATGAGECNADQKQLLLQEFGYAINAVEVARKGVASEYLNKLFPESLRQQSSFTGRIGNKLNSLSQVLQGRAGTFGNNGKLRVSCDFNHFVCDDKTIAATSDSQFAMIFCQPFFDDSDLQSTDKLVVEKCDSEPLDMSIVSLSRATVIIHEATHLRFVGNGDGATEDYAQGAADCVRLAAGIYNRQCATHAYGPPLCPDQNDPTKEGICAPNLAEGNADTWRYLIGGIYFESRCRRPISIPAISGSSSSKLAARDAACPVSDNPIIIDHGPVRETANITGYVRFGDSYASGLGAGTTSGDSCRVGSNNYGNLLVQYLNQNGLDYQQLSCSGDTLDGLNQQIDKWSSQDTATFGTVTIGGNDLSFSDLVANCVITPFTWRYGSTSRAACLDLQNKARIYMQDSSDNGLRAKLKNAYLKIMQTSRAPGFQLFVTGYPTFFNADTDTCDYSSFQLWWGGYNPSSDWPFYRTVFLTKALRTELNDLVAQLNGVILGAVQDANAAFGGNQVHFVDVVGAFEGHRWCEGSTREPDSSNGNTYFFLSNWGDAGGSSAKKVRSLEGRQDSSQLPDGATCADSLGSNPDPAAVQACWLAQGITNDPDGPAAHLFGTANAPGNYSTTTLAVSWFSPTWLIETFHPRTNGMYAYRDAIIHAMQQNGFSV